MIIDEVREIQAGISSRVIRLGTMARRTTSGPLLVRGSVYVAGLVAELAGWPASTVLGRGLVILLVVAALPALFPRSLLPTAFILATVVGWFAATTGYGEALTYPRLLLVTAALYLVHTLCALAAVLPYDAILSSAVLGRWLVRAALVLALTAALGLFAVAVPARFGDARYLVATLSGLALVAGLAGYLVYLVRRR